MRRWSRSGISMIGKPERFGVWTPMRSSACRTRSVSRQSSARIASPRVSLTSRPARTVASDATGDGPEYRYGGGGPLTSCLASDGEGGEASDATGDGPEYRYGGAATFRSCLTSDGQAMKASSDE